MNLLKLPMPKRLENIYRTMHNAHVRYRTVNQGIHRLKYWLEQLKDPPASILDIGCGNGLLCELLVRMKYDVTGLDIVPGPYDRNSYNFVLHNMTTGPLPFNGKKPADRFDYCLSFDVLEHLPTKWVEYAVFEMQRVANRIIGTAACFESSILHLTIREPDWWMELISRVCKGRTMQYRIFEDYVGRKTLLFLEEGVTK
jgi:SAM-dependent methyltransferase